MTTADYDKCARRIVDALQLSPGERVLIKRDRRIFASLFPPLNNLIQASGAEIIAEIPLRKGVDRSYFRLAILGMLAWSYTWYKPTGKDSPRVIAKKMVNLLKEATH